MAVELIGIEDVSKLLHVSRWTIWRRVKKGTLPPPITAPGETLVWNKSDIDAYLAGAWGVEKKKMPETPAQRKWREALEDAECARWGI